MKHTTSIFAAAFTVLAVVATPSFAEASQGPAVEIFPGFEFVGRRTPQGASNRSVAPAAQDPAVNGTLGPNQARVVKVDRVDKPIYAEEEVCRRVQVEAEPSQNNNVAGQAAGAVIGGLLGQGGDSGAANAVGALIGAIGSAASGQQEAATEEAYECTVESVQTDVIAGYEVTYEYNGRLLKEWMTKNPGAVVDVDASGKALPPQ